MYNLPNCFGGHWHQVQWFRERKGMTQIIHSKTTVLGITVECFIFMCGSQLKTKIKEHKYAIKTCNENNVIFNHVWEGNHRLDCQDSYPMYKSNYWRKQRIIESMCMEKYHNFNLSIGMCKLDPIMRSLVEKSLLLPHTSPTQVMPEGIRTWPALTGNTNLHSPSFPLYTAYKTKPLY